jgi:hypothetical protein
MDSQSVVTVNIGFWTCIHSTQTCGYFQTNDDENLGLVTLGQFGAVCWNQQTLSLEDMRQIKREQMPKPRMFRRTRLYK